jgi:hypothetical protein
MTATEFTRDEDKRNKLAKLLKDPVLREALEILESEVEPRTDLPVTLASDTVSAHRYHQFAGVYHVTKGLVRLTKKVKEVKIPQPKKLREAPPTE